MDALLMDLKLISEQLIPIITVVVLILVAVAIFKLGNLFSSGIDTLVSLKGSIKLLEKSLDKAQAPLDSVVKLSKTIDGAHDSAISMVSQAKKSLTSKDNQDTQG